MTVFLALNRSMILLPIKTAAIVTYPAPKVLPLVWMSGPGPVMYLDQPWKEPILPQPDMTSSNNSLSDEPNDGVRTSGLEGVVQFLD
ncbi:hypothetical protein WICPIJ_006283 [Wickerhamomyces pijperi]|uniref:Uncharacterized protein n=1 Tax=Wickerhamomyces pijperi TaxID=599730 RepID=A0A9P8Q2E8_WICPI|nr:hypothetical protein WICPIJ_006283 [Wickerhamomyces pijperi]